MYYILFYIISRHISIAIYGERERTMCLHNNLYKRLSLIYIRVYILYIYICRSSLNVHRHIIYYITISPYAYILNTYLYIYTCMNLLYLPFLSSFAARITVSSTKPTKRTSPIYMDIYIYMYICIYA